MNFLNRRTFITSLVATAGIASAFGIKRLYESGILLSSGEVVIAESGQSLRLPANPKNGDYVQIIVENSTLHRPCIVVHEQAAIAGDHESLILDSIANFKLVYKAETNDWILA